MYFLSLPTQTLFSIIVRFFCSCLLALLDSIPPLFLQCNFKLQCCLLLGRCTSFVLSIVVGNLLCVFDNCLRGQLGHMHKFCLWQKALWLLWFLLFMLYTPSWKNMHVARFLQPCSPSICPLSFEHWQNKKRW